MRTYRYPVLFTDAPEGGWVITCRDLPEAISQADAHEDREDIASGCLQAAIESRMQDGEILPVASRVRKAEVAVSAPLETLVKAALYEAMREANISKSELARRMGVDEKEVRRMLDARHATKIPRLDQAVRALGRRLEIALA
jgi:antitoxin HicB